MPFEYRDTPLTGLRPCQEYLHRPTEPAHWWAPPNANVLGARDLLREEQGTWLGITKEGRVAVLTNFREDSGFKMEARSRGSMVTAFLTQPTGCEGSTESFIESLTKGEGLKGVGGFSLVCGKVGGPLAVISNRTPNVEGTPWIMKDNGESIGLSNAAFEDRSWPKVLNGEKLLASTIKAHVAQKGSQAALIEDLFHLLDDDTLPKRPNGVSWNTYLNELRKSIFIPAIGGEGAGGLKAEDLATANSQHLMVEGDTGKGDGLSGVYGTQKQTVVLVDPHGRVTFVERSLYGANGKAMPTAERDRVYEFVIEACSRSEVGSER